MEELYYAGPIFLKHTSSLLCGERPSSRHRASFLQSRSQFPNNLMPEKRIFECNADESTGRNVNEITGMSEKKANDIGNNIEEGVQSFLNATYKATTRAYD
eukprot:jgi/Psemu1/23036/gm1.23036_g